MAKIGKKEKQMNKNTKEEKNGKIKSQRKGLTYRRLLFNAMTLVKTMRSQFQTIFKGQFYSNLLIGLTRLKLLLQLVGLLALSVVSWNHATQVVKIEDNY